MSVKRQASLEATHALTKLRAAEAKIIKLRGEFETASDPEERRWISLDLEYAGREKKEAEITLAELSTNGDEPMTVPGAYARIVAAAREMGRRDGGRLVVDTGTTRFRVREDGAEIVIEECEYWLNDRSGAARDRPAKFTEVMPMGGCEQASAQAQDLVLRGARSFLHFLAAWSLVRDLPEAARRHPGASFPEAGFCVRYEDDRRHLEIVRLENGNPVSMMTDGMIIRTHGERRYVERGIAETAQAKGWRDPALAI